MNHTCSDIAIALMYINIGKIHAFMVYRDINSHAAVHDLKNSIAMFERKFPSVEFCEKAVRIYKQQQAKKKQ